MHDGRVISWKHNLSVKFSDCLLREYQLNARNGGKSEERGRSGGLSSGEALVTQALTLQF